LAIDAQGDVRLVHQKNSQQAGDRSTINRARNEGQRLSRAAPPSV
jgi:hypothetical protein